MSDTDKKPPCPAGMHAWTTSDEQHTVANHICMYCLCCHKRVCITLDGGDVPAIERVKVWP